MIQSSPPDGFFVARNSVFDTYLRFLKLAQTVQALPSVPKLDAVEERLLAALTASWHAGHALTVSEAMALSVAGAPATVHRKLAKLKNQGFVSVNESSDDLRIKTVLPTRKALQYFERLALCFEKAMKR